MPPLITCVIPVYNGERFLAAAIDSVLAQDHRPLEVLVIDDGSTDSSARIAAGYGSPVRVLRHPRRYPPATRNTGIAEARGEYIAFLDADDLYRPYKLSAQLAQLDATPDRSICLCTMENFWEPGLEEERARYLAAGKLRGTYGLGTMLVRREVFETVGVFDEELPAGDQAEWFMRAFDAGLEPLVIPEVLVDRRMHGSSFSRTNELLDHYFSLVSGRIERAKGR